MKKLIATLTLALIFAGTVSAQNQWPDMKAYFAAANQLQSSDWDFGKNPFLGDDPADSKRFSNLTGDLEWIDSYLEFALLTYYSAAERTWAERGNTILPLNNPKLVDKQLGAAVYKELVVARFLNTAAAVSKYEAMLTFITGRGNAARAEIEAFYRQNVGALVSAEVDAQFNRVEFLIDDRTKSRAYNTVLTRDAKTGQYKLSYAGYFNGVENTKELTAPSLEALLAEMRKNTADFSQTSIDTVRAQAALMPAVSNVGGVTDNATIVLIKKVLTDFYSASNQTDMLNNYKALVAIHNRYHLLLPTKRSTVAPAMNSLAGTLIALSPELARVFDNDAAAIADIYDRQPQRTSDFNSNDVNVLARLIQLQR